MNHHAAVSEWSSQIEIPKMQQSREQQDGIDAAISTPDDLGHWPQNDLPLVPRSVQTFNAHYRQKSTITALLTPPSRIWRKVSLQKKGKTKQNKNKTITLPPLFNHQTSLRSFWGPKTCPGFEVWARVPQSFIRCWPSTVRGLAGDWKLAVEFLQL